jgi:hypothetical protein
LTIALQHDMQHSTLHLSAAVFCRWSNPRSEGKLMSFDLVDKAGGEIRATAWNDQVDQFQDMIQVSCICMERVRHWR